MGFPNISATALGLFSLALTTCRVSAVAGDTHSYNSAAAYFYPSGVVISTDPLLTTGAYDQITLNESNPFATLDYGYEVAGYPFFNIKSFTGLVQIEVKYSEVFEGLSLPWGDGPYPFAVALSNTFRVETYNVTEIGEISAFLIQGGQRWQSIRLLTNGSVTLDKFGLKASITPTNISDLPGQFSSSNPLYDDIWELGTRAVSAACFEAGSQGTMWEISQDNGAFIRGMRPALSAFASGDYTNYTLTFSTKIIRGGTGWSVAGALSSGAGFQLNLNGEFPEDSTFVNTNKSLTPSNSVILSSGWSFVNQTTLPSYYMDTFDVPFAVHENEWYEITTVILGNQIQVSINNVQIFSISIADYYISGAALEGSWGFGPWQDQAAYVKDVKVTSTFNGTLLYSNTMTNSSILSEYGVLENKYAQCMDGAKRDRLVWLGDFFHTTRIIGTSTQRWEQITGTFQTLLDWQISDGELPISPSMGYDASATDNFATGGYYGLPDYQILGFLAFIGYIQDSNDLDFVVDTWSQWKSQIGYLLDNINNTTGLVTLESFAFIGPYDGGLAVSCAVVQALNGASDIALAINDTASAALYKVASTKLTAAINEQLWNEDLGLYSNALADPGNFSVAGLSFAITSGVASPERALKSLAHLNELRLGPGYKDSSAVNSSDPTTNISPNTNGFLLSALMEANQTAATKFLLESVWGAMLSNKSTSTGASWEYLNQDGQPGLSLFTSGSHPWGGAATYVLTKYIAGLKATTFGYESWQVMPAYCGFGLDSASAKVDTPYGPLSVKWSTNSTWLDVEIVAPQGTQGTFVLNRDFDCSGNSTAATKNLTTVNVLEGGQTHVFSVRI